MALGTAVYHMIAIYPIASRRLGRDAKRPRGGGPELEVAGHEAPLADALSSAFRGKIFF
jgi:hypothetical protein